MKIFLLLLLLLLLLFLLLVAKCLFTLSVGLLYVGWDLRYVSTYAYGHMYSGIRTLDHRVLAVENRTATLTFSLVYTRAQKSGVAVKLHTYTRVLWRCSFRNQAAMPTLLIVVSRGFSLQGNSGRFIANVKVRTTLHIIMMI